MKIMRDVYYERLKEFCTSDNLRELLQEVVLEDYRVRHMHYLQTGTYPEQECLLGRLIRDLDRTKEGLDMLKMQEAKEEN